jgi:rubrerythrin
VPKEDLMPSFLDFTKLTLHDAFDFAIMLEEDAQLRYEQLARLVGDDPGGVGQVFRMMVENEAKHRSDLVARREALFRDDPPRIEISLMDASVERPEVDDDALPKTARAALEVTLAAERRAHAFYGNVLARITDPELRAFFEGLRRDEAQHAALIERKISRLVASTAGDDVRAPPQVVAAPPFAAPPFAAPPFAAPGEYPDRALVEAVLPRFDAATQAVARSIIVDGLEPAAVAAALGVSLRSVARKLAGFLQGARPYLALAFAAAALVGCNGAGPDADGAARDGLEPQRSAQSREAIGGGERPVDGDGRVAARDDEAGVERAGEPAPSAEQRAAASAAAAVAAATAAAVDLEYSEGLPEPPQQLVVPARAAWAPSADVEANPQPIIEDVWPNKTAETGGERVVIRGTNLQAAQVLFGMVPATIVEVAPDQIVVTAPPAEAGDVAIVVTNRDGSYALAKGTFSYYK